MTYEPVIGLEIHAQLRTQTKIFCGCSTAFGAPPNSQVCPVCTGQPGALPVLNRQAVDYAVAAALALGCRVQTTSIFARKNYFYPDLPKGYQISQYERPLALGGGLEVTVDGTASWVGLTRIHMEEDAGKSLHEGFLDSDRQAYVDYNRSGVPLIEIVSEPDMRSAAQAAQFFSQLREILVWLGVNDGNMEEGSLRCDANVSVRPHGQTAFGTKTEVKNVNSFRYLQKAIEYEIERQIDVLAGGGTVRQETRLWDSSTNSTHAMRSKEEAHDYRYFPEPDLPPLVVDEARVERIRASMPETAGARRRRFVAGYGLPEYDAGVLTQSPELADYFEAVAGAVTSPKLASNWVMGELLRTLNDRGARRGRSAGAAAGPGRADRAGRTGHHQRLDRQGRVRPDVRHRARGRRDRGGGGPGADWRRGRRAGDRPRGHRRERRSGGRVSRRQAEDVRVPGRPGDEAQRRQGQPAARQPRADPRADAGLARRGCASPR